MLEQFVMLFFTLFSILIFLSISLLFIVSFYFTKSSRRWPLLIISSLSFLVVILILANTIDFSIYRYSDFRNPLTLPFIGNTLILFSLFLILISLIWINPQFKNKIGLKLVLLVFSFFVLLVGLIGSFTVDIVWGHGTGPLSGMIIDVSSGNPNTTMWIRFFSYITLFASFGTIGFMLIQLFNTVFSQYETDKLSRILISYLIFLLWIWLINFTLQNVYINLNDSEALKIINPTIFTIAFLIDVLLYNDIKQNYRLSKRGIAMKNLSSS